jgi:membrane-associated phospholipid phosphatase
MSSHHNTYFFLFYLLLLVVGFFITAKIPKGDEVLWINQHHNTILDIFFYYATSIGNGLFYVGLILYFFWRKVGYGILGTLSFAITGLVVQFSKRYLFSDMVRPKLYLQDFNLNFVDGVEVLSHHSFPSGHSATAFSMMFLLALYTKQQFLGILFCFIAAIAAFSRVYLVQHFLFDVIVGSIIGVAVTFVVNNIWLKSGLYQKPLMQQPIRNLMK